MKQPNAVSENVDELEEKTFEESDSNDVPPSDIVAYNELRSCADLFRMYESGSLEIHPEFQRDVVWQGPMQTRFIDSLIKQLPIPSMCFSYDFAKQKWMVIDGLQRMASIVRFLSGDDWVLSKLDDVDPKISGVHVSKIKDKKSALHNFYQRVENLTIPITVIRCDHSKRTHTEYLFAIFHRLNTGGMKLNNQEIRNCIFGGKLNNLLKELDDNKAWRKINRMEPSNSYRFTKQELILRVFAFSDSQSRYQGHLAKFLNAYMHENRNPPNSFIEERKTKFSEVSEKLYESLFSRSTQGKLSVTLMEALFIGAYVNFEATIASPRSRLQAKFKELRGDAQFSEAALREGLSKRERVIARHKKAIEIFSQ